MDMQKPVWVAWLIGGPARYSPDRIVEAWPGVEWQPTRNECPVGRQPSPSDVTDEFVIWMQLNHGEV